MFSLNNMTRNNTISYGSYVMGNLIMVIMQDNYGECTENTLFYATDKDSFILKFQGNNLLHALSLALGMKNICRVFSLFCKTSAY